jgi:pimeloyl-ACP methyl ester carboxylesterase
MMSAMRPSAFARVVAALQEQFGAFNIGDIELTQKGAYDLATVHCAGRSNDFDLVMVFDRSAQRQLQGLHVARAVPPLEPDRSLPTYVDPSLYTERAVAVGDHGRELPGTLSLPRTSQRVAAVVLIHGSGPQDRDETTGANRPFRDFAAGLAAKGVAVLRYEKRTFGANRASLRDSNSLTLDEEAVDDAVAAVKLALSTREIDPERVFVAGHSLGGLVAALVATREPQVRGIILLAAPARPLEDLLLEQAEYLEGLSGTSKSATPGLTLSQLKEAVARVKGTDLARAQPDQLPLGVPAAYWLSLRGVLPVERVNALQKPTLLVQGDRDYQVTMKDFAIWQRALSGAPWATLRLLAGLNHLFAEGTSASTPAEYMHPEHVSVRALDVILDWLRSLGALQEASR